MPTEEYDWFQIPDGRNDARQTRQKPGFPLNERVEEAGVEEGDDGTGHQREIFEFPGPLYSVVISPASCNVAIKESRNLRAVPRNRKRKLVEENLTLAWEIVEGSGELSDSSSEIVTYRAPQDPELPAFACSCDREKRSAKPRV